MQRFKSITGATKRIASTSGHVILVGDEFTEVPDHLISDAQAAGLLSEEIYLEAKAAVEAEMKMDNAKQPALTTEPEPQPTHTPETTSGGVGENQPKTNPTTEPDALRKDKIISALQQITILVNTGETTTPNGVKLMHHGRPILAAVEEFTGFEVSTADIDAALA